MGLPTPTPCLILLSSYFPFSFLACLRPTDRISRTTNPLSVLRGKYDRRLPDRRCGLKDASFNSVRRTRIPRYSKNMEITIAVRKDFLRQTSFGCGSQCAQISQVERPKSVFDCVA